MTVLVSPRRLLSTSARVAALIALLVISAHSRAAAAADTYYMLVFSAPVHDSDDAEYNRWYNEQHAPDVVAVPGFVSAQRFVVSDVQLGTGNASAPLPKYLVLFKIETDDFQAVMAEVARRLRSGETVLSPTFDRDHVVGYMYRALGPKILHRPTPADASGRALQGYVHFVLTVPMVNKEAEFNQWYDTRHAPEMAALPGFVSAQRLILQKLPSGNAPGATYPPTKYAALFELQSADISATAAAMKRQHALPSDSVPIDPNKTQGYTYRALGPVIYGDEVRRARAQHRTAP